ncbi:MAG: tRNA dihydrouridine synthase DusB [Acidimicrobiales bacterium]
MKRSLTIGPITVDPPVVLAPMAGVTNSAFRRLCRRYGAGLYVSEMVNARGLLEGGEKSWQLASFAEDEPLRSLQLYGTDPRVVAEAVRRLIDEGRVDHLDFNFGCPAPKVTRHGGGAAVPTRPRLLAAIICAAVKAADAASGGTVPVTVKMRMGLDEDRLTYLEAGRIAADNGAKAVALHSRTAAQRYSGRAHWDAITALVEAVPEIPVLGNGDIWTANDALLMIERTGCAGVVIGRACLGRPWFFGQLADVFAGLPPRPEPPLGEVALVASEHARLLAETVGERRAMLMMRKHLGWYLTGYAVGSVARRNLTLVASFAELDDQLAALDHSLTVDTLTASRPRGTQTGPHAVVIPEGWLDAEATEPPDALADSTVSGG